LDLVTGHGYRLESVPSVTIPQVWQTMRDPGDELVRQCRYPSAQALRHRQRDLIDALGNLVSGVLQGLFDAETTIRVDWNAPIQSLSLSRLKPLGNQAIGVALACINSWSGAMTDMRDDGAYRIKISDEVWRQMRLGEGAVEALDSNLRLSRDERSEEWLIGHKPSDWGAVGDAGSRATALAEQFWALCDTKIMLAQDEEVAEELRLQMGLSATEKEIIAKWCWNGPGRSLWRIGSQAYKIQTPRTALERQLFDTNADREPRPVGA
ncbi:MAG: ATP-binding protein, partial [Dermatophilaceae bacterium]